MVKKKWSRAARAYIFGKSGGLCWYCGHNPASQVEHQIPEKRGGTHDDHNLVGACIECNRRKAGHGVSGNPNWTLDEYRAEVAAAIGIPPAELRFYGEQLMVLRAQIVEKHPARIRLVILAGGRDDLLLERARPLPAHRWSPPYVYRRILNEDV
jgi:hypothetical protein